MKQLILYIALCSLLSNLAAQNEPYGGGSGDGFALESIPVTTLTNQDLSIVFGGGSGDGFALESIPVATFTNEDLSVVFGGGSGDGFALESIPVATFTNEDLSVVFGGGSGDGFALESSSTISFTDFLKQWIGAVNSKWQTAGNWKNDEIPMANDGVLITTDGRMPIIDENIGVTVNSLTVNTGASLTVLNDATLQVNSTATGNVTYTRNLPTNNWYLIASPIVNQNIDDFVATSTLQPGNNANIAFAPYANDGTAWNYYQDGTSGSGNFVVGKGYSVAKKEAGTINFTGKLNTEDAYFQLKQGVNNFNLVGNPFTTFINSEQFLSNETTNLISETLWLWNQAIESYETKVSSDGFSIAPGQAFFIEAAKENTIAFTKAMQLHQNTGTFQRTANIPEIMLTVTNGNNKPYTKVRFTNNATTYFDNGYDGKIFDGATQKLTVYTAQLEGNSDEKLAIQALPISYLEEKVIPVGVISEAGKMLTFSAKKNNIPSETFVYLEDREQGVFTNLSEENYTVTPTENTNGTGRFYIHTKAQRLSTSNLPQEVSTVQIFKSEKQKVTILGLKTQEASMRVFSILGKELFSSNLLVSNGKSTVTLPNVATGMYIVEVRFSNTKISKKIIL